MLYYLIHRKNYFIPILCIILRSVFKVIDSMPIYYLHHQIVGSGMTLKSKPSLRYTSAILRWRMYFDSETSDCCNTRRNILLYKISCFLNMTTFPEEETSPYIRIEIKNGWGGVGLSKFLFIFPLYFIILCLINISDTETLVGWIFISCNCDFSEPNLFLLNLSFFILLDFSILGT